MSTSLPYDKSYLISHSKKNIHDFSFKLLVEFACNKRLPELKHADLLIYSKFLTSEHYS